MYTITSGFTKRVENTDHSVLHSLWLVTLIKKVILIKSLWVTYPMKISEITS